MGKFYFLLLSVLPFLSCKQETIPSKAGFTSLNEFDQSRLFDTTSKTSHRYFRPVKIDVFYPGTGTGSNLSYGNILDQYEKRMDYEVTEDSCRKTSLMIVNLFGEYLKMDSPINILHYPLSVQKDLEFAKQRFPLIVYVAGMNGSTWENVLLFEHLVKKGMW